MNSIILEEIGNENLGLVTIIDVKVTDDLRQASVYYSVYGDESVKTYTMQKIEESTPLFRYQIGKRIRLRFVPEIRFLYDQTPQRAERIFELLSEINKKKPKRIPKCPRKKH